ncbi:MAG: hypothetical protein P1U67_00890 [Alcanivoracaceae bacterium]|nr:hypothetical protein [Alcanivoracaceae bacterium]
MAWDYLDLKPVATGGDLKRRWTVRSLEEFGRTRLSESFFMRDFLHSEISQIEGIPNIPEDPDLAIENGSILCRLILEPLQYEFGRISIRSGYRSAELNSIGSLKGLSCARNEKNYSKHIWDKTDSSGRKGATACIVVPSYVPHYEKTGDWLSIAQWIIRNIPEYSSLTFFPKLCAFNIGWHEARNSSIQSHIYPKGFFQPRLLLNTVSANLRFKGLDKQATIKEKP